VTVQLEGGATPVGFSNEKLATVIGIANAWAPHKTLAVNTEVTSVVLVRFVMIPLVELQPHLHDAGRV
jgi:hypothetical protein